jgi:hypothetical protein
VIRILPLALALCVMVPATAAAEVVPIGQLGVRYRGFFLVDGPDSELYDNRPETDVRLGASVRDPDLLLRADVVVAVGDGKSPSQRWSLLPAYGASDTVHIDTAALTWGLDALPDLEFQVGRAGVPWVHTGLVWDEDVRLPAVTAQYVREGRQDATVEQLRASPGYLYLSPGGVTPNDEVWAVAGELGATLALGESTLDIDLGTFHLFGHKQLGRAIARGEVRVGPNPGGFTRNTTPTDADPEALELTQRLVKDGLASRYHLITLNLRFRFELAEEIPGAVQLETVVNAGAADPGADLPFGVVLAFVVGEAARPGQGEVAIEGVYIGADATLDVFNRDVWGTNVAGGGLRASFLPWEGLTIGFRTFLSVPIDQDLRGIGQGRGELGQGDEVAVQVHASSVYAF